MPLATAVLAGTGVAQAQQASDQGVLDEVVVTAQKRSEDLQKVPISLTVLGGEKLEQLQVASFDDYAKHLPSVSFESLGPGQAQLYFRGIATAGDGLHAGSLPATGLYIDEIPVTTIAGSLDMHIYDIARVEALSGPQGTLYGASSLSGTLRIITNKPDMSKFSAGYDVKGTKFGKGDAGGGFEGFVNIPLSDNVAVRLVGYFEHDGGYIDNVPFTNVYQRTDANGNSFPCSRNNFGGAVADPCTTAPTPNVAKKRANTVDSAGGRAALKVNLNDNWSITPTVMYQHQKANGNFSYNPKVGDLKVNDLTFGRNVDQWYQTALLIEGKIGNFDLLYSGGYMQRRVSNVVDYADYTVAYDYYGTGTTNFSDASGTYIADPTQYTVNKDRYTKLSHEIRLSTPQDNRLRAVVGAFYQRQTDDIRVEFSVDGLPQRYWVTGQPNVLYLSDQDRTDRDKAVFTEMNFDLTDSIKLTGGIRKFYSDNTLYGFFGYGPFLPYAGENNCFAPATGDPTRPCINTDKRKTENGETHKLNAQWQIDADRMVYATYSTGFRPGGNNRRVEVIPYAADRLSNYELGWKTAWLDRSLRINGAVFFEKWKGAQYGIQGTNGITSILNVGNAESKGIEGDITWAATDSLVITGSAMYVKAKLTTNFCTAPTGVVTTDCEKNPPPPPPGQPKPPKRVADSGAQLPVTPKFKGALTARYKFNVGDYASFLQGSVIHQGAKAYSLQENDNAIVGEIPSFTSFDFVAGTGKGNWTLEAFIENMFDKRGIIGRVSECGVDPCVANTRAYAIKPMNFGVRFGQKF
jgi:iron complex outermembrane receptor protein